MYSFLPYDASQQAIVTYKFNARYFKIHIILRFRVNILILL